jgi:hypothetical protein
MSIGADIKAEAIENGWSTSIEDRAFQNHGGQSVVCCVCQQLSLRARSLTHHLARK